MVLLASLLFSSINAVFGYVIDVPVISTGIPSIK